MPSLYPQAKGIVSALKAKGIQMAIASRSPTSDIANTFIDKLNIKSMFVAKVVFHCVSKSFSLSRNLNSILGTVSGNILELDSQDGAFSKDTHKDRGAVY